MIRGPVFFGAGPRIESRSKGYVVELDPDWLDDDEECI